MLQTINPKMLRGIKQFQVPRDEAKLREEKVLGQCLDFKVILLFKKVLNCLGLK